jgi:amidohydrolase
LSGKLLNLHLFNGRKYMDILALKNSVCAAIDANSENIIEIGETILNNPELGFKEEKTAALVKKILASLSISSLGRSSLDLSIEDHLAVTGVKALARGKKHLFNVAVIGEMDAVICHTHPNADKGTGASHSCGHNAQIAAMLGAAFGLVQSGAIQQLDGDVTFFAVPAEEFVELEYREKLKNSGKIKYYSGKQELIRLGLFDDIDAAMMVHAQGNTPDKKVFINGGSMGFIGKLVKFTGKEAHAGGAPYDGINALNAAMLAMTCINAQRETFKDEDHIRVHPIITKGGDLVNVVPADVRMETYVRGKTIKAVLAANEKVNRSLKAGAYAVGAKVEIKELAGYLPLNQDINLSELFKDNILPFVGENNIINGVDMIGSSDIGDLSSILPAIQPTMGGFKGSPHSSDFEVSDKIAAYILPAKAMAMTVVDLLYDDAKKGISVKESFKPLFTKEAYLSMWDELSGKKVTELI